LFEELKAINLCPKQSYADKLDARKNELPTDEEVAEALL